MRSLLSWWWSSNGVIDLNRLPFSNGKQILVVDFSLIMYSSWKTVYPFTDLFMHLCFEKYVLYSWKKCWIFMFNLHKEAQVNQFMCSSRLINRKRLFEWGTRLKLHVKTVNNSFSIVLSMLKSGLYMQSNHYVMNPIIHLEDINFLIVDDHLLGSKII